MLELMLAGNNVTIVPGSGPGNKKLLAGDKTDGWFGMVESSELPTAQEILSNGGGGIASMPQQASIPLRWMKAVINGKFIFVANAPFNQPALLDIYNRGQIFGTDDIGASPPSNRYNDQNQLQIVTWIDKAGKTWSFKLRVLSNSTNSKPTGTTVPTSDITESESWKLYSHIIGTLTPDTGKRWASLVNGVDFYSAFAVSQTIVGTQYVARAQTAAKNGMISSNNNSASHYFPVLEVIDPDVDLIPPANIAFDGNVLSGTGAVITSDAIAITPSELGMLPQAETAPHIKAAIDNTVPTAPPSLVMLDHAERAPFMK